MSYAERVTHLKPEGAYQVLAQAQELEAQGREIIHLEIGQPDFETFANVSLAGIRAIATGKTRYTLPVGMPSLREVIAEDAGKRRGISITPEQVVVSPGAKPNLFFPTLALVQPGCVSRGFFCFTPFFNHGRCHFVQFIHHILRADIGCQL